MASGGGSILVINAAGAETRVALVENGTIHEYYLERKREKGIVGNIYKGRVVRVLPGMQAAFVDIGLDKAAFLYVSDVVYDPDFARAQFELTEGEHEEAADVPELDESGERPAGDPPPDNGNTELHAEVESVEAHAEALHDAVHEVLHSGSAEGLDEQSIEDEVDEILEAANEEAASDDEPLLTSDGGQNGDPAPFQAAPESTALDEPSPAVEPAL